MKFTLQMLTVMLLSLALTSIPARASQGGVGGSAYTADLLVSGLNTGRLDPGEEYWYAYSRIDLGDLAYSSIVLSLNFEAEGRAVVSRVNFQVFTLDQVDAWLKDNSGPVDSLGLGAPVSADFDALSGERLWAGPVLADEIYYVRIFNLSPNPVRFRLTVVGQKGAQGDTLTAGDQTAPVAIPASVNVPVETGEVSPALAQPPVSIELPVLPIDNSPASTRWLLAAQAVQKLPSEEAAVWLMTAAKLGWLPADEPSAAAVPINPNSNQPDVPGGGQDSNGSEATAALPVNPTQGYSIYPNQPLRLFDGTNTGRLAPRAEHWYTFTPGKVDGKTIENMSLTMFFTPGEPNIARNVIFELYTGSQYQIWERGTPDDMEHFGAGAWMSRDGDYITGERLWHGTVVDGDRYFVKILNGTNQWIDYHLMTGDIINTELGPKTVKTPPAAETIANGKDIGSPLPIGPGHNRGRLAAGEDIWFSFEYKNYRQDKFEFRNYLIELQHTPGAGYVTNYVNMEIYPFQEQQIWRRGDTDQIQPLGAGSDLDYNRATNMHTWVWNGHLVSNTIYFIRVRNDSIQDIDFDLFIQRR